MINLVFMYYLKVYAIVYKKKASLVCRKILFIYISIFKLGQIVKATKLCKSLYLQDILSLFKDEKFIYVSF